MNLFVSFMRTVVPLVAGLVLTQLTRIGVHLDSAWVASVVTTVLSGAYYTVFRLLEQLAAKIQYRPLAIVAGMLLGWATPPDYPVPARPATPAVGAPSAVPGV